MTTREVCVADYCPTCKAPRFARIVFATDHSQVSVATTCPKRADCEREMVNIAKEAA